MDQKIGIKIEGPSEDKLGLFFVILLYITLIVILLTMALLLIEFFNISIPKFWEF